MSSTARIAVLVAAVASLAFGLAPADALAHIFPPPTVVPPAPPPIPALPGAGETPPPADVIADPVEPQASCGDWYLQGDYGDRWPAGSVWWEYSCVSYFPVCTGNCNQNYTPDLFIDFFYWDGSQPVFYGEFYGAYYDASIMGTELFREYWWDEPTGAWYELLQNVLPTPSFTYDCSGSNCTFDAGGSSDPDGTIVSYWWLFGDGTDATGVSAEHTFARPGTYTVWLYATDDDGGQGGVSRTVTIAAPNLAPTAAFGLSCSGTSCAFNGSGSSDLDGTIVAYEWVFGDGTTGSSADVQHVFAQSQAYTVTLTVTDDDGATGTVSKSVHPISLSAYGYRVSGLQKVDLSWNGPSGTTFDLYRNGVGIATVASTSFTDNIDRRSAATYAYRLCATSTSVCSNEVSVRFK
jgi:chitodextrinase